MSQDKHAWIYLSSDHQIVCHKNGADLLKGESERLSDEFGCPVTTHHVGLGLLLCLALELDCEANLDQSVEWVVRRERWKPDEPITNVEVSQIRTKGKLPTIPLTMVRISPDDPEGPSLILFNFSAAVSVFQSAVPWLQRRLKYPVEWHHVAMAVAANLDEGAHFLDRGCIQSKSCKKVLVRVLENARAMGRLPTVTYVDESGK